MEAAGRAAGQKLKHTGRKISGRTERRVGKGREEEIGSNDGIDILTCNKEIFLFFNKIHVPVLRYLTEAMKWYLPLPISTRIISR